jgi:predicted helicase
LFSTYQSIEVIAKAQRVIIENGFSAFDMIIYEAPGDNWGENCRF